MNRKLFVSFLFVFAFALSFAQNKITGILKDESTGDPVAFATVSITKVGQTKPVKYILSSESGQVSLEGVRNGNYVFKAELLGFKSYEKQLNLTGSVNLGEILMQTDSETLDAATISDVGNPIIIKKDTIEYNATAFKTTDNDLLEDLLKKLPGVEIDDDGGITVNGETIKKITIDGKTFFLDDPSVASKNLPARMINKLKVIRKKSEQAEFTGIDDGEEENIIDLSVKPGMMKGLVGNVQLGGGRDIPSQYNANNDWRYQGNAFVGKFTKNSNLSVILNANNTNNRGAQDRSGNMMNGMMGGGMMGRRGGGFGRGNGITTTYMGGVNLASDNLCDGKMELGGNYLFNRTENDVEEKTYKETYLDEYTLLSNSNGTSNKTSDGHNVGVRMIHKFSDNTSIVFEPQITFGKGNYIQNSLSETSKEIAGAISKLNDANVNNAGSNKNISTSGMLILRQRLGIPGRTITAFMRYSFSNNDLDGVNYSKTTSYSLSGDSVEEIDQYYNSNQKSTGLMGRVTYTEPMGNNFYIEGNYSYNWTKSTSDKETFDSGTKQKDYSYSNNVINRNVNQTIGANVLYQKEKFRAQVGFAALPNNMYNSTTRYDTKEKSFKPWEYSDFRWNFSPTAMIFGELGENSNIRGMYRGSTSQPSTSKLMPVPDISNPLNVSFGNPYLNPYFNHRLNVDYRFSNKQTFTSFTGRLDMSYVQNPITNAIWYGSNGAQYSMPFNGPDSFNTSLYVNLNSPIAKSNFSIMNFGRFNYSRSSSFVGGSEATSRMSKYPNPVDDYYGFMEQFIKDHPDLRKADDFETNTTRNFSFTENLRFRYRIDALEVSVGGRVNMNKSWYTIASMTGLTTWNNQIYNDITWTWDAPGLSLKSEFRYNFYRGYTTEQPDQYVWNAEIIKSLFKKKVSLSLKGYDILGQSRNITVSDSNNYHSEGVNNTLGRYIILSLTYRFGSFGGRRGGGMMGGPGMRGPGGPPPMM